MPDTNAPANGDEIMARSEAGAGGSLVDHVEVVCEALLGRGTMTIGALQALRDGDVVTLDASPVDPVDVVVNGKVIARGEIVTIDDRFAVRITELG